MSCITPPFPSHGFGLLDLNTVPLKTSPAIAYRNTPTSNQRESMPWLLRSHHLLTISPIYSMRLSCVFTQPKTPSFAAPAHCMVIP
ncbi:MAG: hypothetical protein ABG776_12440 [Cyanobacteria bacterium J06555_13]